MSAICLCHILCHSIPPVGTSEGEAGHRASCPSGNAFGGGLWCVYAVRQTNQVSKNLVSCLICLRRAGYNTVLINNGRLCDKLVDAYLPYCHTVILKPCGGRDFGGYKWGTQFLASLGENTRIDQVIYCNDSIFIRPSAFEQLLNRIKQLDHDYIGITETFEIHHHVQSWFFAISARIYHSPFYKAFWNSYKSYSHREHCINNGEVKISKVLLGSGVSASGALHAEFNLGFDLFWNIGRCAQQGDDVL